MSLFSNTQKADLIPPMEVPLGIHAPQDGVGADKAHEHGLDGGVVFQQRCADDKGCAPYDDAEDGAEMSDGLSGWFHVITWFQ